MTITGNKHIFISFSDSSSDESSNCELSLLSLPINALCCVSCVYWLIMTHLNWFKLKDWCQREIWLIWSNLKIHIYNRVYAEMGGVSYRLKNYLHRSFQKYIYIHMRMQKQSEESDLSTPAHWECLFLCLKNKSMHIEQVKRREGEIRKNTNIAKHSKTKNNKHKDLNVFWKGGTTA